jgi:hypothetical protein
MELIWLLTPHHTGTHFLRLLLELNFAIDYVVFQDQLLGDGVWQREWGDSNPYSPNPNFVHFLREEHPTNLVCNGRMSMNDYIKIVQDIRPAYNKDWTVETLAPTGILPDEKSLRYQLTHAHGDFFLWGSSLPPLNNRCKYIITIRDPLLSICSGLRRVGEEANARKIIQEFQLLVDYPGFKFCIDQYKTRALRDANVKCLFRYLDLPLTAPCRRFAKRWMPINETIPAIENYQSHWTVEQVNQLREAKKILEEQNDIHPILEPWVDELRASGLQPSLQKLGYDRLTWYNR